MSLSPKSDEASAMPPLVDYIVEEVLLRFPPEDPASLVRAALVCRRWRRLVFDPGFRRFSERHRTPPMLGFLANLPGSAASASFVPTAASSFRAPPVGLRAIDSRHGRVLLLHAVGEQKERRLIVWDPVTGQQQELPVTTRPYLTSNWNAAVLCASAAQGCRHLDCHQGHFLVVVVGTVRAGNGMASVRVYLSETGSWSKPLFGSLPIHRFQLEAATASAVLGDAVCFKFVRGARTGVLQYNVSTRRVFTINLMHGNIGLIPSGDGDGWMGFANVFRSKLYMWLLEIGASEGHRKIVKTRVFELALLLPAEALASQPQVAAVADGAQVVFMRTSAGFFTVDLKSCQVKKVGEIQDFDGIVPYMSFCTPCMA